MVQKIFEVELWVNDIVFFIVKFEDISHVFVVFLLLLWTSKFVAGFNKLLLHLMGKYMFKVSIKNTQTTSCGDVVFLIDLEQLSASWLVS